MPRTNQLVNSPNHLERLPIKFLALFISVFSIFLLTQIAVSRSSEPRTRVAADEDSPAIVKLVAGLFDEQNTAAYAQLEKIGKPAVPALIRAVSDPRTTSVKFEFRGFHPGGYSPFERITSLLEPFAPSDAVRPLNQFIQITLTSPCVPWPREPNRLTFSDVLQINRSTLGGGERRIVKRYSVPLICIACIYTDAIDRHVDVPSRSDPSGPPAKGPVRSAPPA